IAERAGRQPGARKSSPRGHRRRPQMNHPPIPLEWLPTIPRRYATTTIDGLLVLAVFMIPSAVLPQNETSRVVRILLALLALFVYEPLGTGRYVTLGQWVTGVRVRRMIDGRRIGVLHAWGRIVVKAILGIFSFVLLPFFPGRR